MKLINTHLRMQCTAAVLTVSAGCLQVANAATVQVVGSFNDTTASASYFFNRTYNQDNDLVPAMSVPSNAGAPNDSVSYFGWGIDAYKSYQNKEIIQSHFWFNGTGSVGGNAATTLTLGDAFSLGSFTYTNEKTRLSGGMVEIDFQMDIMFDGLALLPVEYRIGIDNTLNVPGSSDDTATLLTYPANFAFTSNSINYMMTFNGFSRDGGSTFETSATLPESGQTTAEIFATVTVVPVPAAIWLFGSGLAGLLVMVKRKANS